MKKFLKKLITTLLGSKRIDAARLFVVMLRNYCQDLILYKKYSTVFGSESADNLEALAILEYHGIEKGMLHANMKPAFAKDRVTRLHQYLNNKKMIARLHSNNSQVVVAYQVACEYYELHQNMGIDITAFYTEEQYCMYKKLLDAIRPQHFSGMIEYKKDVFYKDNQLPFAVFAFSRKSIRNYTGERIDEEILKDVIRLALSAPSVCNRQASKVYVLEDKKKIDKILEIQGGFNGYTKNVNQLLILTNNRSFYYTIGERNQFYIDGGIFLMNLLYALHYYRIANCPANWGKEISAEKELSDVVSLHESEKIICIIPIGIATESFRVTLSKRRRVEEVFETLN